MGWVEARNQIVTIVEGTTLSTKKRGLGSFIRYKAEASALTLPDSRCFWFEVESATTIRMIRNGGTWESVELDLVICYRADLEPAEMLEAMLLDRAALSPRFLDGTQWNRPTSTILKIAHSGEDNLMPTTFERVEGATLMRARVRVEYTN